MIYKVTLGGKIYEVEVEKSEAVLLGVEDVKIPVATAPVAPAPAPAQTAPAVQAQGTVIESPMPGTILSVLVAVGDSVKVGQVLVVLEAMKMENDISAPSDGVVKQIAAQKGATVDTGDILLVI
ncbi:MAG: biotin/lipoyl-binding protein [Oscillospiraceae bacterium]|jgi:biotin carboxyl carrier protein|nr:biotin/lipoyl-binding protein [Oscillospiraceae bacterium]